MEEELERDQIDIDGYEGETTVSLISNLVLLGNDGWETN